MLIGLGIGRLGIVPPPWVALWNEMKHEDAPATSDATNTITDPGNELTAEDSTASESVAKQMQGASRHPCQLMDGARIKHYTIVRSLGRGGTAEVFLAQDTKLERLVALKRPHLRNASSLKRLLSEARILARLRHDCALVVYEVNQSLGHPFMTLEYVEGQTLRHYARRAGANFERAVKVMIPVVRGLVHIHSRGVVHRDLKPENILMDASGGIKIIDFGAAELWAGLEKASIPENKRTKLRAPMGTLRYMAPEQIRAERVDHRADLWAAGILLHELACGEHPLAPFRSGWHRRLTEIDEPMPIRIADRDDHGLAEIIARCLKKRRDERIETAEELLVALEKMFLEHRSREKYE